MQLLTASPLLAAESHLDQPAVVGAQATWTWRQIHAASLTLSQRLGPATAVCNLCTSRVSFLVTWLAALRCGALLVLPPSGGSADLAEVLRASADTLVVVDDPDAIQAGWRQSADVLVCQPDSEPSAAAADTLAWRP
ncbi:MAG TPA: hypothetical protein VLA16_19780, partial [Ideonella sp.]|nr:hypothetical protein [Ideonella sp.]